MPPIHSDLPIIQPPRKSQVEKYGALFHLGLGGLVVLALLIGWFGYSAWSLRDVFREIYVINDPRRSDAERIEAAYALSRDPRATQRQLYDNALSRTPPDLARYLLAEALTSEAVEPDPRGFALAVAYSEGWPDWLRLLLLRPLAYAAGEGIEIPPAPLAVLQENRGPIIALWANYALAVGSDDEQAARRLAREAESDRPEAELAGLLREALGARQPDRNAILDRATRWLRRHHPDSARVWDGWEERDGRLRREPAPELRDGSPIRPGLSPALPNGRP